MSTFPRKSFTFTYSTVSDAAVQQCGAHYSKEAGTKQPAGFFRIIKSLVRRRCELFAYSEHIENCRMSGAGLGGVAAILGAY